MGNPRESAAAFFDRTAAGYARARYGPRARPFHRAFFGGRLRLAARALADLPPGSRVVDAGCGPSPLARALRARGCAVVGVDIAPGMLAEARAAGALPVQGDAGAIPLRDGCADALLLLGVTTYVADPDPLLREAARVVRPGGILVVTATNAGAPDTVLRALARRLAGARPRSGERLLLSGVPVHAHDPGEFEERLRAAGFEPRERRGHNYTVFPFGRVLEVPSVLLSRAAEAARLPAGLASDTVFTARRKGEAPAAAPPPADAAPAAVPVVRAIARLNLGGPAMHVALLSRHLDPLGYRTTLLTGRVEPGEADMTDFALERGVVPEVEPALGRSVSPVADLRSFGRFLAVLRRRRPAIVHTHTAKAGTLGRLAALLCGVPVRVHTFHGHVFHGYFGRLGSFLAVTVEKILGLGTHRILAVSEEVRRDLVDRYEVAPEEKVTVVPLGLDLAPFARAAGGEGRGALRREIGAEEDEVLVGIVGRLVPVKDHDYFLRAGEALLREVPGARLVIVGSGPLEEDLRRRARELDVARRCAFLGWRRDTPALYADLDVVALTSRNEGTPVALIEAAAAGLPVVARDVGGVRSALREVDRVTLVPPEAPPAGFAASLAAALRTSKGAPRRADPKVLARFSVDRLCRDVDRVYREELVRAREREG